MVQSTVAYLAQNEEVWKSNPAFVKALTDLRKAIAAVNAAIGNPHVSGSNHPSKLHTRELLEDLTSEIADQLFALAEETGDLGLAAASDFSRASLDRLTDEELEHTAKHVCEQAGAHLDALANYLVVAADVAELATLTSNFSMAKPRTRIPVFRRSLMATTLEERLRTANRILRGRLDKLVNRYRLIAPEFVSGYLHARVLSHATHRTTKPLAARKVPPAGPSRRAATKIPAEFVRHSRN